MMRPHAALITGGAKRIGKLIASHLAAGGVDIALHYNHSQQEAESTEYQLKKYGVSCQRFQADLSDSSQATRVVQNAVEQFPHLNILINCAAIYTPDTLPDVSEEAIDRHWQINTKAPMLMTQEFAKQVPKGQIIHFTDAARHQTHTTHTAYLVSKHALHHFAMISARQLAPDIRVNCIAPGWVLPPVDEHPERQNKLKKTIPLGRQAKVEELTRAVDSLLNNEYLTGQTIYVDGGLHLI